MSKVVNVAVETVLNGHCYEGITVHDGVDISFEEACFGQMVKFANTDVKPVILYNGISSVDISSAAVPHYLQICVSPE